MPGAPRLGSLRLRRAWSWDRKAAHHHLAIRILDKYHAHPAGRQNQIPHNTDRDIIFLNPFLSTALFEFLGTCNTHFSLACMSALPWVRVIGPYCCAACPCFTGFVQAHFICAGFPVGISPLHRVIFPSAYLANVGTSYSCVMFILIATWANIFHYLRLLNLHLFAFSSLK